MWRAGDGLGAGTGKGDLRNASLSAARGECGPGRAKGFPRGEGDSSTFTCWQGMRKVLPRMKKKGKPAERDARRRRGSGSAPLVGRRCARGEAVLRDFSGRRRAGRGSRRPANWGLQSSHGGRRFLLRNASGTLKVSEIYVCNTSESFLRTRLLFLKGRVEKEIIFVYVLFCIIRSLYLLASSTHVK